jgi:hypothetical protein
MYRPRLNMAIPRPACARMEIDQAMKAFSHTIHPRRTPSSPRWPSPPARLVAHPGLLLSRKQAQRLPVPPVRLQIAPPRRMRGSWLRTQVHAGLPARAAVNQGDADGATSAWPMIVKLLCNTNNLNNHKFYSCATTIFFILPMTLNDRSKWYIIILKTFNYHNWIWNIGSSPVLIWVHCKGTLHLWWWKNLIGPARPGDMLACSQICATW